ncbi:MAG: MotA/TolQ/ExbB proton channel family protein [Candidatus Margulisbacteria bacterium]|nr:MotA/TolQ/ExbB proton channel family protein [Candidatus Margulisiibacteriota bacterium]
MDKATLVGILLGAFFLVFGMGVSSVPSFINVPSLLVTFGGTFGAIFVSFTMPQVLSTITIAKKTFNNPVDDPITILNQILALSEKSRREGILALDKELKSVKIPFLVKGLQLVVDGSDADTVREVLEIEKDAIIERHKIGKDIFETLGAYAPAWGMIGTIIGLIQMLKSLEDPGSVGPAMAVALLTTFYGAVAANLFFIPMAGKLKIRSQEELFAKDLILAGIIAIQSGDNPRTIKEKLAGYLPPLQREQLEKNGK